LNNYSEVAELLGKSKLTVRQPHGAHHVLVYGPHYPILYYLRSYMYTYYLI